VQPLITGAVVSTTVTEKLQPTELPDVSVVLKLINVIPRLNELPLNPPAVCTTLWTPQLSDVCGWANPIVAAHELLGVACEMFRGHTIDGTCRSAIVTLN